MTPPNDKPVLGSGLDEFRRLLVRFQDVAVAERRQMELMGRSKTGSHPPTFPDDLWVDAGDPTEDMAGRFGLTPWEVDPENLLAGTGQLYRIMFDSLYKGVGGGSGGWSGGGAGGGAGRGGSGGRDPWQARLLREESALMGGGPGSAPDTTAYLTLAQHMADRMRGELEHFSDEGAVERYFKEAVEQRLERPPLRCWASLSHWMRPLRPHEFPCLRGRAREFELIRDRLISDRGSPVIPVVGPPGVGVSSLLSAVAAHIILNRSERWVPCWLGSRNRESLERELIWYLYRFGFYTPKGTPPGPKESVVRSVLRTDLDEASPHIRENDPPHVNLLFILDPGRGHDAGNGPDAGEKWMEPLWQVMNVARRERRICSLVSFRERDPSFRLPVPDTLMEREGPVRVDLPEPKDLVTLFLDRTGPSRPAVRWAHQAVVQALDPDAPATRLRSVLAMAHCFNRSDSPEQEPPWREVRDAMQRFMTDLIGG